MSDQTIVVTREEYAYYMAATYLLERLAFAPRLVIYDEYGQSYDLRPQRLCDIDVTQESNQPEALRRARKHFAAHVYGLPL